MPPISSSDIIAAALDLLKNEGLQAITFRRLQQRLNVTAPSIYWRFANKEALLGSLADAILREEFGDARLVAEQPWVPWFRGVLIRLRHAMLAYPDGGRVVAGARLDFAPTLAQIADAALAGARAAGRDIESSILVVYTALHFTYGRVIEEQEPPALSPESFEEFLDLYPSVRLAVEHQKAAHVDADSVFQASIDLILRDHEA